MLRLWWKRSNDGWTRGFFLFLAVFWFLSVFPHFHEHSCIGHGRVFEADEHEDEACPQCGFHAAVGMAFTVFFLAFPIVLARRRVADPSVPAAGSDEFQPFLPRPPPSFGFSR